MENPNRPVILEEKTQKGNDKKAKHPEERPVLSTFFALVLIWIFVPLHFNEYWYVSDWFFGFRYKDFFIDNWRIVCVTSIPIPIIFFYKWIKFKSEDHER